jgi:hypothetical protein
MTASQGKPLREIPMLHDFDEINLILAGMVDEGIVEPIDDPNFEVDFWDWADIVGVVDEFVPEEYSNS